MTIVLTDERLPRDCELGLMRLGLGVVKLPAFSRLSTAVASHTDLLILPLGDRLISTAEYCEEAEHIFIQLSRLLPKRKFDFTADSLRAEYPHDCALNALVMGGYIFCRSGSISPHVLNQARQMGLEAVFVNQGYPACTVLKLNDGAAITADRGMAKALTECGIRTTVIEEGGISLPPYPHGFIGGCAGVWGDKLLFMGDARLIPDYERIRAAAEAEGLTVLSLGSGVPLDVGGMIFAENNI